MAKEKKLVEEITSMDTDFARWYTDIVLKAELVDYTSVKGCLVIRPAGYAIWENMKNEIDRRFKETGIENCYLPMFIPESLLQKEADHVEGFAPEVAWVTYGGMEKLDERLCVRPTSETLFCDYYAGAVKSYRDLPQLLNQWCSVVRWEKTTRPFLRSREFLWQEGHTVHATAKEAHDRTVQMLDVYADFFEKDLAIPVIKGVKTDKEKFAGAEATYTIEALMHDGKASFGMTTRIIGAVIMVHGDNSGLKLPPHIAPVQVNIIPVAAHKEGVLDAANTLYDRLKVAGLRVKLDNSEKSPGFKFAESEMRGIPLRIEIGPKDIENNQCVFVRRDTGEKSFVSLDNVEGDAKDCLENIQTNMYETALAHRDAHTYEARTMEELKDIADNKPGFIKAMWCGDRACEDKLKEFAGVTSRCMPDEQEQISDVCVCCGKKAKKMVYWGKAY